MCDERWAVMKHGGKEWLTGPEAFNELHVPKDILASLLITVLIPKGNTEGLAVWTMTDNYTPPPLVHASLPLGCGAECSNSWKRKVQGSQEVS